MFEMVNDCIRIACDDRIEKNDQRVHSYTHNFVSPRSHHTIEKKNMTSHVADLVSNLDKKKLK